MADEKKVSLLRKHVAPPRPVKAAGAGAIEKLLEVALPRSADQLLGLQVRVKSVSFEKLDQAKVVAALSEFDLVYQMSRAGSDTGLIVIDPPLLSALIEIQTLGKVTGSPPQERSPTNTDATVASDLLDRWLSDAARTASEQGLTHELITAGFTRADGLLGRLAVELTLDPGQYRSLSVKMTLGDDAKIGSLTFYVPQSATSDGEQVSGTLGHQLRSHLLDAPVEMTAVLTRASRSLDDVVSLRAGEVISISNEQLQSVRLEAGDGTLIATARLGQSGGKRAVRPRAKQKKQRAALEPEPLAGAMPSVPMADAPAVPPQADFDGTVGDDVPAEEAVASEPGADGTSPVEAFPELPDPDFSAP